MPLQAYPLKQDLKSKIAYFYVNDTKNNIYWKLVIKDVLITSWNIETSLYSSEMIIVRRFRCITGELDELTSIKPNEQLNFELEKIRHQYYKKFSKFSFVIIEKESIEQVEEFNKLIPEGNLIVDDLKLHLNYLEETKSTDDE